MPKIDTDADVILLLDFAPELPCESIRHSTGSDGHNPSENAAFKVTAPCCGHVLLMCAGWVSEPSNRSFCNTDNGGCGRTTYSSEWSYLPI